MITRFSYANSRLKSLENVTDTEMSTGMYTFIQDEAVAPSELSL